jgi:hypothetical protein
MLGFVLARIPWNALSNLELQLSYRALQNDLVLPSTTTHSNICWREYPLTVNANMKQLPSRDRVTSVIDRWTSANKLAMTLIVDYYVDQN